MNKQIITFDANEQSLIKTGGVDKYSSNKVSYIEAHFNLGENWSGFDSVRAVWFTWHECITTVLDPDGVCIVPHEVLTRTDKVMVNLVGSISEDDVLTDRLTTYPVLALTVDANAKVCGSNTQPITPSEYEQFVEAVKADADRAEEAKEDARGFASSAEISAQNASISETNASTSEDNAKASELNAETYKNQAQTYAQNANNSAISAENAKDEAEDARDVILGMRAEATTLPEGSSATASYNDGVMSFGIPKGDTGATGATGETGATPQLSIGTVTTTTEPSVTITGTAENPVLNFGLVKGDKGDTGEVSLADLSTLLPTDTASGQIASFPDGQSVIPALSVVADIEPIQSGSGTPSPDNIRPISGHDEVNVSVCGVNVWDEETELGGYSNTTGEKILNTSQIRSTNRIKVIPNDKFYVKCSDPVYLYKYGANGEFIAYWGATIQNQVITIPSNCYYLTIGFRGAYGTTYKDDLSINYPSTDHEYHAYNGTTYEVSFGTAGTVYGGTVDVVSGVLTVTKVMYDGGDLTWTKVSGSSYRNFTAPTSVKIVYSDTILTILSSQYKSECNNTATSSADNYVWANAQNPNNAIAVKDTSKADMTASEFKTAMQGVQFACELATPTTYQLTPTEVQTLLGQNNIWGDTGDVNVTYKADVTKWLEKQLS